MKITGAATVFPVRDVAASLRFYTEKLGFRQEFVFGKYAGVERDNARRDAALTWWTEPASAKPGLDYVSQAKVSQSFPKGQDSMSVFVKLLPNEKRGEAEVFYIAVADQDAKSARQIAHTAVRLPSNKS